MDGRPQSRERFVGRANTLGLLRSLLAPPQISWRGIRGGPSVSAAHGIVEYGEGPVHLIGVVELEDGKMITADYYFAYPFDPPEYRVPFTAQAKS